MPDLAPSKVAQGTPPAGDWSFAGRVGFRFAFIYWTAYCVQAGATDLVLWMVPGASRGLAWLIHAPHWLVPWVGRHVFGLTGLAATEHPTAGSSDTALQYVLCFCLLMLAASGTVVWTIVSELRKGRREYWTLSAWLRLALRFTLGMILLNYGFLKVFGLQFSPPHLLYLTETYGDSSPMRLLWAFMGASVPYTIFGGLAEVVPGLFLLFRRTSTLGALISAGVMLNVVLLNFCYDVPVKLFSTHLLLASLFLVLPDAKALWHFFFSGRAASLSGWHLPAWSRRSLRRASHVLQVLVIGSILYQSGWAAYRRKQQIPAGHAPLYGVWSVDKVDGIVPQVAWTKLLLDRPGELLFLRDDGKQDWYDASFDAAAQRVEFLKTEKPTTLRWTQGADGTLVFNGVWLGNPASIHLHKMTPDAFPLQARGFHWIQEYPYNR